MSRCLLSLNPCNPWTRWLACWCEQWFSIVLVLFCCSVVSFRARACRVPVCLSCVCVCERGRCQLGNKIQSAFRASLTGARGWMFLQSSKTQNPLPPRIKDPLTAGEERGKRVVSYTDTAQPDLSSFHTRSHACCFEFFEFCLSFFVSLYGRGNIFFTAREEAGRVRVLTPSFRANEFVLFPPRLFPPLLQSACTTRSCFVQRSGWVLVHFEEQKKKTVHPGRYGSGGE